jgi:hypothetical protein
MRVRVMKVRIAVAPETSMMCRSCAMKWGISPEQWLEAWKRRRGIKVKVTCTVVKDEC